MRLAVIALFAVLLLMPASASAVLVPILECLECAGDDDSGGDPADLRGIRFNVSENFAVVELRMAGSIPGIYIFRAELRRSVGFTVAPERILTNVAVELPSNNVTPFKPVRFDFGNMPVTGTETFTLKIADITGPGTLYFEVFGIGSQACCIGVDETSGNSTANPSVRGDPSGFRVLADGPQSTNFINSSYVSTPPDIDGSIGFGEWSLSNTIEFDSGFLTVVNDRTRLYILVDLLEDTGNDTTSPDKDFFWLTFDVDRDGQITPDVDLNYGTIPANNNMRYQYYTGPATWTGLQPETFSSKARGFGCFFADGSFQLQISPYKAGCRRHRVWEFGIDLAEIDADPGDTVRMGLRVVSPNPSIDESIPPNFWFTDFGDLIEVKLGSPNTFIFVQNKNATVELEAAPFEITQAIQTRGNDLPLVADKTTLARVYVDTDYPPSPFVFPQYGTVSLYASRGGVDLPGSPLTLFHSAPLSINRGNLNHTANFKLPKTWDDGAVAFRAVVRDYFHRESASTTQNLNFIPKEKPTYWVVPINSGTSTSPVLPDNDDIAEQETYLETIYPVADVNFVRKPWQSVGPTTVGNTINALNDFYGNAFLAWIFGLLFSGTPPFDLPDEIYGFNTSGGGLSDPEWAGGLGKVARGYIGSSQEGTMAHEIIHNLGPGNCNESELGFWGRHISSQPKLSAMDDPTGQCIPGEGAGIVYGCGAAGPDRDWQALFNVHDIGEFGVDLSVWPPRIVDDNTPEIMSYCDSGTLPTKWISPYRWENMFDYFATVKTLTAEAALQAVEEVLYVSGVVTIKNQGRLDPIMVAPGMVSSAPAGDYSIDLLDANGRLIHRFPFVVSFRDVEGNRREIVPFNFQLPAVRGTAQVQLVYKQELILDSIRVSKNPPEVEVISPNGGETWGRRQEEKIEWTARDLDGDALLFSILYSPNEGKSWFPVASNLRGTSYLVDPAMLPGSRGQAALIRVIVTDGFRTTSDESDKPFEVLPNPPEVEISAPSDGAAFAAGSKITFAGRADDVEDESIPDEKHVWSYGDKSFAVGPEVEAGLPEGEHQITLTAIDSEGDSGSDSITIFVIGPCEGDFDNDGDVDGSDLAVFAADFGRVDCCRDGALPCEGDFDRDCDVDGSDLAVFANDFGRKDCP
jgi:hypothetical protein